MPDGEQITFIDARAGTVLRTAGMDFGDFLVWRKDGFPSYELAVVADDHAMQISEVVRGEDLLTSTARQILLYRALGWEPPKWFHCPLMRDEQGNRLAKRHASLSLREMRSCRSRGKGALRRMARIFSIDERSDVGLRLAFAMIIAGQLLLATKDARSQIARGWLRIHNGKIVEVALGQCPHVIDLGGEDCFISPGFIDTHVHLPQFDGIGCDGLPLLEWLNTNIFPIERRWEDASYAASMTERVSRSVFVSRHDKFLCLCNRSS